MVFHGKQCQTLERKKQHAFQNEMLSNLSNDMNKLLSENLQNIDRNKTVKFGMCKCNWSGDFWLKKTHFEKTAFKDYVIETK